MQRFLTEQDNALKPKANQQLLEKRKDALRSRDQAGRYYANFKASFLSNDAYEMLKALPNDAEESNEEPAASTERRGSTTVPPGSVQEIVMKRRNSLIHI